MNTPLTGALLAQDRIDRHRSMGAFGKPAWQSHVQLRAMLRQRLGEHCAHYFATPSFDADAGVIRWTAHSNAPVRGWHELSPEEQGAHALDMESIRGQLIGFAAELRDKGGGQPGGAAAFASLLDQAMKVPADGHFLYLVGDQPVIAFWGFETQAGGSVDPAVASAPDFRQPGPAAAAVAAAPAVLPATVAAPRRRPWWWWLLALLAALLLLLLLLGLLRGCGPAASLALPGVGGPEAGASAPGAGAPGALPGDSGVPGGPLGAVPGTAPGTAPGLADPALPGASAAPDGSAALPPGAASAVPLPGASMPLAPGQEPPVDPPKDPAKDPLKDPATDPKNPDAARTNPPLPPSAPGLPGADKPDPKADAKADPKADPKAMKLPPDAATAGRKMDFLQGDWKAGDGLVDQSTKQPLDMALKFGPDGKGELSLRRPDGTVCSGPVQGQMKDGKLSIQGQQAVPCSNGSSYGAPRIECAKASGGQTDCFGINADGSRYYMDMKRR